MVTAYVLINCVLGSESDVLKKLKGMDSVREAHQIFGSYDIIATVENNGKDSTHDIIGHIRSIDDVRTTSTLIVAK